MLIYTHNQPESFLYEEYVDDMRTQRIIGDVYHTLNKFNISPVHNGLTEGTKLAVAIQIPVLILRGEGLVVSDEMTKEIIQDLGEKARFVELKDCGHSPSIDNLDLLVSTLKLFLQE